LTERAAPHARRTRTRALALVLALLAGCGGEPSSKAPGISGRYRLPEADGGAEIVLEEKDGVVTVTSSGGTATGRVVAPGRIEGREEVEGTSGTFVFEAKGDHLVARFSVKGPSGEPIDLPEMTFHRVTEGAAAATAAPDASPFPGSRDPALTGHWRHTEARGGGEFSMATDHHLVLEADGGYTTWNKSVSSLGTTEGERATGVWEAKDGVLRLRADGGTWMESRYQISGDTLLRTLPSGDKSVYERL
jgi:hypothetical protein